MYSHPPVPARPRSQLAQGSERQESMLGSRKLPVVVDDAVVVIQGRDGDPPRSCHFQLQATSTSLSSHLLASLVEKLSLPVMGAGWGNLQTLLIWLYVYVCIFVCMYVV